MKAMAVYPDRQAIELVDHPEPQLTGELQVKLRIHEVGVCGTDKEICSFQYGTPPADSPYLVIGHESLGEVTAIGAGVRRVAVGDLVVPMVRRPCDHPSCRACRDGRQDFCFTGDFTERGIKGRHGFMTEYVVDEERYMNQVPPELRPVAILVEPLTIAEKGLEQLWSVQRRLPWLDPAAPADRRGQGHNAVVLGAGPVGLLGAMALRAAGFSTYVYSREPAPNPKADVVEAIGATYVSSQVEDVGALATRVGNIDLVYEAVGASDLAFSVMSVLGTNGAFIFTGVPGRKGPISVDTDLLMRDLVLKNQVVLGTVNAGRNAFEAAIADLGIFNTRWPAAVQALLTGRFPIEGAPELLLGRGGGIKNVIVMAAPA